MRDLLFFLLLLLFSLFVHSATEQRGQTFVYFHSAPVASTIEHLTLYDYTRCFASVDFFDASSVRVAPSAGTVTITVKTINTNEFIAVMDNVIDATNITVPDWAGNTVAVRATPAGITGATTYQLTVSCNRY